jgi:thiol-disulfide isomerase/thioredoxin
VSDTGSRTAQQRLIALGGLAVIVGAAVAILLLIGIIQTDSDVEAVELLDTPPADGASDVGPEVGKLAPDFEISDFDNERYRLSDFRDKVVYINFWATWCIPCQKELPDIAALQDEFPDDLVVITVNRREPVDRARSYIESVPNTDGTEGVSFAVNGLDPDDTLYERYRGLGMPTSIFVSPSGIITERSDGIIDLDRMRDAVEQAIESG